MHTVRFLTIFIVTALSCTAKKKGDDAPPPEPPPVYKITDGYPLELGLAVFPDQPLSSTSTRSKTPNLAARAAEAKNVIEGKLASCLAPAVTKIPKPSLVEPCFTKERRTMYFDKAGLIYGTKNGLNSRGELCAIEYFRSNTDYLDSHFSVSLGMFQSLACQGAKEDLKFPAIGESVDVKDILQRAVGDAAVVISASIKRVKDMPYPYFSNGIYPLDSKPIKRAVLRQDIVFKVGNVTREAHLGHIPENGKKFNTEAFDGSIWIKTDPLSQNPETQDRIEHMSLNYRKGKTEEGRPTMYGEIFRVLTHKDDAGNAFKYGLANFRASDPESNPVNWVLQNQMTYSYRMVDTLHPGLPGALTRPMRFDNPNSYRDSGIKIIQFIQDIENGSGKASLWRDHGPFGENESIINTTLEGSVFEINSQNNLLSGCVVFGTNPPLFPPRLVHIIDTSVRPQRNLQVLGARLAGPNSKGSCRSTNLEDDPDFNRIQTCSGDDPVTWKWQAPALPETDPARDWGRATTAKSAGRQCFVQNAEGKYLVDASKTTSTTGTDAVRMIDADTQSPKPVIPSPDLLLNVIPFLPD